MLTFVSVLAIIGAIGGAISSIFLIVGAATGELSVVIVVEIIVSMFVSIVLLFALKEALEKVNRLEEILKKKGIFKDTDLNKPKDDYGKWISRL